MRKKKLASPRLSLKDFERKAKAIVATVAIERDKLRDLMDEYEEILNDVDEGVENFEAGLALLSQQL